MVSFVIQNSRSSFPLPAEPSTEIKSLISIVYIVLQKRKILTPILMHHKNRSSSLNGLPCLISFRSELIELQPERVNVYSCSLLVPLFCRVIVSLSFYSTSLCVALCEG